MASLSSSSSKSLTIVSLSESSDRSTATQDYRDYHSTMDELHFDIERGSGDIHFGHRGSAAISHPLNELSSRRESGNEVERMARAGGTAGKRTDWLESESDFDSELMEKEDLSLLGLQSPSRPWLSHASSMLRRLKPRLASSLKRKITTFACILAVSILACCSVLLFHSRYAELSWGTGDGTQKEHSLPDQPWSETGGKGGYDTPVATKNRLWGYSHNDEMQGDDSLNLALGLGFGAIEIDVRLEQTRHGAASSSPPSLPSLDPEYALLTGHREFDVTGRTLWDQYLAPLMDRLDANNAARRRGGGHGADAVVGLYVDDPEAEVAIVIDMKSDGDATWPYLDALLQPFLAKSYLTTYNETLATFSRGPLRIIGTGNTPLAAVYHQPRAAAPAFVPSTGDGVGKLPHSGMRYIFFDAPLLHLSEPGSVPATVWGPAATFDWTPAISPMASDHFPPLDHLGIVMPFEHAVVHSLRRYTNEARARGIESRWWGALRKPTWVRRRAWEIMQKGGADWTGGDDLEDLGQWLAEHGRVGSGRHGWDNEDGRHGRDRNHGQSRGDEAVGQPQ